MLFYSVNSTHIAVTPVLYLILSIFYQYCCDTVVVYYSVRHIKIVLIPECVLFRLHFTKNFVIPGWCFIPSTLKKNIVIPGLCFISSTFYQHFIFS